MGGGASNAPGHDDWTYSMANSYIIYPYTWSKLKYYFDFN